jgi:hypothetical protein
LNDRGPRFFARYGYPIGCLPFCGRPLNLSDKEKQNE